MLGEVIHGYRIGRLLSAEGGFGDVYFATHVESGAEAVVKVLKPEMSALRDVVARFFNEARAAASIHHPGIVQIHNVGYHGDRAYLLMERLRGADLESRLRSGPLPLHRAIVFLRQTAGAIGAAHERGIVHRDLKPANLFIVEDPDVIGGERIKVLDFGIAKLTVDSGAGKTQGVFGTPAYMSPEQCASTGAVDARADLYSLGCIFYELVCGRPPFGHGGIELIAAHLRDTPVPPRAVAPWVPAAVERVILQLLEKQPDRRIASCAALIAALDTAAAASGLPGAGASHLPAAGPAASVPRLASGNLPGVGISYPTTLGSSAGAVSTAPARRGIGVWLGVGAVVVVAAAIAVVVAMPGRSPGAGSGSSGSGEGSPVVTQPKDAGALVVMTDGTDIPSTSPDAPEVAAVQPDAALVAATPADAAAKPADAPAEPPAKRSPTSHTESQAEVAARLNEEGRAAMYSADYRKARSRFQEAMARVPDAKYCFNLATADFQLGLFDEAATAARRALAASPSEETASKTRKLLGKIAEEAKAQGIALHPPISASELGAQDQNTGSIRKSAATHDEARKLTEAGKVDFSGDRYEKALASFQRAYEIEPSAQLLVDIGHSESMLGRCPEARRTLQRVIATWPSEAAAKKAEKLLERIGTCK